MAATKGAMTSLPASPTIFLPTVEEPENNRINFRDSLKFFQEQLVVNGASFPSPASTCRTGNDTLKRNGSRFCKEQNTDNSGNVNKENDAFESEIQTVRSCKIPIPTVDTILESVRVLRAIQKSQEERGSTWNLDVTSKTDIESDFNLTDDWIHVSDITYETYSQQQSNCKLNDDSVTINSVDTHMLIQNVIEIDGKKQEVLKDVNDSSPSLYSNTVNEICSFWPSNTLVNEKQLDTENITPDLSFSVELKDDKAEFHIHTKQIENENDKPEGESNIPNEVEPNEEYTNYIAQQNVINETQEENIQIDSCNILNDEKGPVNHLQNQQTNIIINKDAKICDTADSTCVAYNDLLTCVNEKDLNTENNSNEILNTAFNTAENEQHSANGLLKIDTYEDVDTQKQDIFLFNESIWKESCSPDSSNSTKIEHNDSDSGIGTQRSASSLSPNNPHQMQKDSWSDTCSSHYASAECSPYHSLNSVYDASLGLNITPAFAKEEENVERSIPSSTNQLENTTEKLQDNATVVSEEEIYTLSAAQQGNFNRETDISTLDITSADTSDEFTALENEGIEQDTEGSYCFVSNYTLESPTYKTTEESLKEAKPVSKICDIFEQESKTINGHNIDDNGTQTSETDKPETTQTTHPNEKSEAQDGSSDVDHIQKFTSASCDLISIVNSLYTINESPAFQVLPTEDEKFEETLFILSEGAFCEYPEDNYLVNIEDSTLHISKDSQVLLSLNMKYGEVSFLTKNVLKIDNRMGRCIFIKCDSAALINMKNKIELHSLKHWQSDCLQLVHYPLKCHQNVIIIDLGSCSTRAGILMDQPTLPSIFFPTICATDKATGTSVYGMEALQPEVRQHSNLSFPVRPSIKITKHTIDIDLLEGLFKKIFNDLHVDPAHYTVQVCLPRNLSINAQNALVKLLLENLKVKDVSLTNQALLTLYAHDVSTAVVVDIGDRTDVLPVVDGFIVETGVTKLPHGGQRLIHHMKHGLAEKRISLSNDIDSFVVQYIIENIAYVAEDYDAELQIAFKHPDLVKKTVTLQPSSSKSITCKSITLDEARFKIPEGLFNPELWGLDSPGIHHLVQKAIQATSVDVRKKIAENIYVSGGVTMLPGFVERLNREVTKLSKAKIIPKVFASNHRYHCTYIGACKFAKMEVFPQVCISLEEYSRNSTSALKKCALYF